MLQAIMLCRLAITIDFIGALIKSMLSHMGIVRALKEFGNVVDILPSPVTEIFYYFTVIIAVVAHSLAWPDRFFPFFFGVAEKGSGPVHRPHSS